MTVTHSTTDDTEPPTSLRERKKTRTRRALRRVALDLVAERGFSQVTVEDIAAAAEVSPRTFFNYFPSKEAALFGPGPERQESIRLRLIGQSPGASALEVLREVLTEEAGTLAEEATELGGDPASWLAKMKATQADPHLTAARAAHMAWVECTVAGALAERLGTNPAQDPYPLLLASAGLGAVRTAISFWAATGGSVALEKLVDSSFVALTEGLPESCTLRGIAAMARGPQPGRLAPVLHDDREEDSR